MIEKLFQKYKGLPLPLKASVWFTVVNFLQSGVSIVTTPIFTRLLPKAEYGLASTYVAWQNIFVLLVTLSLYKAMMNIFKETEDYEKVTSTVSSLSILVSCAWVVLGILLSNQLSNILGLSRILTVCIFISLIPQAVINCWTVFKRYTYDYVPCIIQTLVTTIGSALVGIFCVLFITPTAESKTVPLVLINLFIGIVIYISMMKKSLSFYDKKIWSFSLSFCIALLPHYLSEFILQSSDKLMINAMCGSKDVAIYSLAYSLGSLINLVTSAINSTIIPYRYQRLKDKNYAKLAEVSNLVLWVVAIALIGLMLIAPEVTFVFGGKQYEEAKYLVIPICIGVFFNFIFQLFSTVQEYYERKFTVVLASILSAVLNIVLNYIFIRLIGYKAAAYTTLFCYMLFSFVHYLFYRKVCREELNGIQVYNIKGVLAISITVVVAGVVISRINSFLILKYTLLIIIFVISIIWGKKYMDKEMKK